MMREYMGVMQRCQEIVLPNGIKLDLFYIGTVANTLGRTSNTIRAWEISGVIPETFFKDKNGRRLYTAEQIDVILNAAVRAKITQGSSLRNTSFSRWVYEGFEKLREKYTSKKGE